MRPEPAGERRPGALEPSENRPDRCGPPGLPLWESRPDILLSNRPDDSIRRRRLPGRRGVSPAPPLPPPTPLALLSPPSIGGRAAPGAAAAPARCVGSRIDESTPAASPPVTESSASVLRL